MSNERILLSSRWGEVTALLAENESARAFARLLPVTITMRDHLQQEKTGSLPSPLPEGPRQRDFSKGMLGLWSSRNFVIYYRSGRVPPPGIIVLGNVVGDVSIFDRPGPVSVTIQR